MKNGKVNVNAHDLAKEMQDGETRTLVIREDSPLVVRERQTIGIEGIIKAPGDWFENRKADFEQNKCHVLFSKQEGKIELIFDEESYYSGRIYGELIQNPLLKALAINKNKTFTIKELGETLKMHRLYFGHADECKNIVESLSKIKISVDTKIEQEQRNNGRVQDNFEVTVDSSINTHFTLVMPLYIGYDKHKFEIEVCIDVRNRTVALWLESVDLKELLEKEAEKIIAAEIKRFDKVVCIEKATFETNKD